MFGSQGIRKYCEIRESVDRIFSKLTKKDPKKIRIIEKKIKQICEKPCISNR